MKYCKVSLTGGEEQGPPGPPPPPISGAPPCRRYVQSYIKNCFGTQISIGVQSGDWGRAGAAAAGGGDGEVGPALHPGDGEGLVKVTLVPKLQPPGRWKGQGGKFSARYLEGYCFLGIFTF